MHRLAATGVREGGAGQAPWTFSMTREKAQAEVAMKEYEEIISVATALGIRK